MNIICIKLLLYNIKYNHKQGRTLFLFLMSNRREKSLIIWWLAWTPKGEKCTKKICRMIMWKAFKFPLHFKILKKGNFRAFVFCVHFSPYGVQAPPSPAPYGELFTFVQVLYACLNEKCACEMRTMEINWILIKDTSYLPPGHNVDSSCMQPLQIFNQNIN